MERTPDELTVEQLAARVEMSVRNIREWQALGLLPPPVRRGRVGIYGQDHVARVRRIKELKADGFRLDLIRRILDAGQAETSAADVHRVADAFLAPFHAEEPLTLTTADLLARLNLDDRTAPASGTAVLHTLAGTGLIQPLDDGRIEIPSPRLLGTLEEMVRLGFAIEDLLVPLSEIARHHQAVANLLIGIYRDQVWEPFLKSGLPSEGWPQVASSAEHLRPLLYDAVLAAFRVAMNTATRHAIVENADRLPPEILFGADVGAQPSG